MADEENQKLFEDWLWHVKEEAIGRGSSKDVVNRALKCISISHEILKLDAFKPETTLSAVEYFSRFVNDTRVSKGISALADNLSILSKVEAEYGVPSSIIVAVWGIESSYGTFTGTWDTIQALTTLAYGSKQEKRAAFFRNELLHLFEIIEQGHGPSEDKKLRGSWAGAMGQCQFMPSSFLKYAVDYDDDGRCDIWESCGDVFASIANYLRSHGWKPGCLVAQKANLPLSLDSSLLSLSVKKTLDEWKEHNVSTSEVESCNETASLVAPDGLEGPTYMVFDNFNALMSYNPHVRYALAVWELASSITDGLSSKLLSPQVMV